MTRTALFVDLPNLYTSLLNSGIAEPRNLRDYFLYWFDFDRLALALTETYAPVWIFYSGKKFGPKPNRVEGSYLEEFITRINSMRGVTAYDVNIPGEQREPARFKCEQCGKEGVAQWESEKGIDSSLTVHLFDTYEAWDTAFLLSGDADFVPVVRSLRRRGKIVTGAGFEDASSALVRECYEYLNLRERFFALDFDIYRLFRPGGLVESWLTAVQPRPNAHSPHSLIYRVSTDETKIFLSVVGPYERIWFDEILNIASRVSPSRLEPFRSDGSSGHQLVIRLDSKHFGAINEALKEVAERVTRPKKNTQTDSNRNVLYKIEYQYDPKTSTYILITD